MLLSLQIREFIYKSSCAGDEKSVQNIPKIEYFETIKQQ